MVTQPTISKPIQSGDWRFSKYISHPISSMQVPWDQWWVSDSLLWLYISPQPASLTQLWQHKDYLVPGYDLLNEVHWLYKQLKGITDVTLSWVKGHHNGEKIDTTFTQWWSSVLSIWFYHPRSRELQSKLNCYWPSHCWGINLIWSLHSNLQSIILPQGTTHCNSLASRDM